MKNMHLSFLGVCLFFASATGATDVARGEENLTNAGDRFLSVLSSSIFGGNQRTTDSPSCTYTPSDLEGSAVVEFVGVPELLTDNELTFLQDTFVEVYNELASGLCDDKFQRLDSVKIFSQELEEFKRNRDLQVARSQYPSRRFSLRVMVLGNCRKCKKDDALFDDAFRRLQQVYSSESLTTQGIVQNDMRPGVQYGGRVIDKRPLDIPDEGYQLIWNGNKYNCDCETEGDLLNRAPLLDEFQTDYKRSVQKLVDSGSLKSVEKAISVNQIVEVECAELGKDFYSEVYVEANGDPDRVTSSELDTMKSLFLKSYESSSSNVCDPLFRVVKDAEVLIELPERRLKGSQLSDVEQYAAALDTSGGSRFRPFRFKFRVSGTCKGCKNDDRLFDDAFRRLANEQQLDRQFLNSMHRDLGYVFENGQCFCSINAPERTPNEDEFQFVLNQNVEAEVQANTLTNVVETGVVQQIDDSIPSVSPSSAPTTRTPSSSPTTSPTSSPTSYPTESPSITESASPSTSYPTERPSHSPSNPTVPTESPMPSPSPSETPSQK